MKKIKKFNSTSSLLLNSDNNISNNIILTPKKPKKFNPLMEPIQETKQNKQQYNNKISRRNQFEKKMQQAKKISRTGTSNNLRSSKFSRKDNNITNISSSMEPIDNQRGVIFKALMTPKEAFSLTGITDFKGLDNITNPDTYQKRMLDLDIKRQKQIQEQLKIDREIDDRDAFFKRISKQYDHQFHQREEEIEEENIRLSQNKQNFTRLLKNFEKNQKKIHKIQQKNQKFIKEHKSLNHINPQVIEEYGTFQPEQLNQIKKNKKQNQKYASQLQNILSKTDNFITDMISASEDLKENQVTHDELYTKQNQKNKNWMLSREFQVEKNKAFEKIKQNRIKKFSQTVRTKKQKEIHSSQSLRFNTEGPSDEEEDINNKSDFEQELQGEQNYQECDGYYKFLGYQHVRQIPKKRNNREVLETRFLYTLHKQEVDKKDKLRNGKIKKLKKLIHQEKVQKQKEEEEKQKRKEFYHNTMMLSQQQRRQSQIVQQKFRTVIREVQYQQRKSMLIPNSEGQQYYVKGQFDNNNSSINNNTQNSHTKINYNQSCSTNFLADNSLLHPPSSVKSIENINNNFGNQTTGRGGAYATNRTSQTKISQNYNTYTSSFTNNKNTETDFDDQSQIMITIEDEQDNDNNIKRNKEDLTESFDSQQSNDEGEQNQKQMKNQSSSSISVEEVSSADINIQELSEDDESEDEDDDDINSSGSSYPLKTKNKKKNKKKSKHSISLVKKTSKKGSISFKRLSNFNSTVNTLKNVDFTNVHDNLKKLRRDSQDSQAERSSERPSINNRRESVLKVKKVVSKLIKQTEATRLSNIDIQKDILKLQQNDDFQNHMSKKRHSIFFDENSFFQGNEKFEKTFNLMKQAQEKQTNMMESYQQMGLNQQKQKKIEELSQLQNIEEEELLSENLDQSEIPRRAVSSIANKKQFSQQTMLSEKSNNSSISNNLQRFQKNDKITEFDMIDAVQKEQDEIKNQGPSQTDIKKTKLELELQLIISEKEKDQEINPEILFYLREIQARFSQLNHKVCDEILSIIRANRQQQLYLNRKQMNLNQELDKKNKEYERYRAEAENNVQVKKRSDAITKVLNRIYNKKKFEASRYFMWEEQWIENMKNSVVLEDNIKETLDSLHKLIGLYKLEAQKDEEERRAEFEKLINNSKSFDKKQSLNISRHRSNLTSKTQSFRNTKSTFLKTQPL